MNMKKIRMRNQVPFGWPASLLLSAAILWTGCSVSPPSGEQPAAGTSNVASEPNAIYLTDLEKCQPASALASEWKNGTWRLLSYATDSFSGNLLLAAEDNQPPEITYPLQREGWHRIYIGIYREPFTGPRRVRVRLSDDQAFATLTGLEGAKDHQEHFIDDIFWKEADLTGRDIVFKQIVEPMAVHAWVAYIKLVPLTEKQVRSIQADRRRKDTKRLFIHNDAGVINRSGTEQEIRDQLEPLRDSDVARVYWEFGTGDRAKRFSKIARDHSLDLTRAAGGRPFFTSPGGRWWAESWKAYHENGVDPFLVAAEYARQLGVEFHASYRPGGFIYPANYGPTLPGVSFYEQHPELVCMNREGKPMPRISYAFPETRRYVLSLYREVATENPIDGVAVLYNRRPPLVAYEAPVVEGFQKKYGLDPRQLPENDPRFMRHRSQFLTQFMRELRAELDQVARELKRETPFEITVVVSNGEENLLLGMDLATWVEEGLVDVIIPYSSVERIGAYGNKVGPNTWDGEPSWEDPEDVEWFVSLVKGTRARVALNMMPRFLTKEAQYRKAHQLYEAGVEHLFFWDGTHRVRNVLRLGHREEVSDWMASGQPPFRPTNVRVWELGGWDLHTETPG